jgi:phytoene synthase
MTATLTSSDTQALSHSRDYCRTLTKKAARNFYYGLKLMPEPKRSAMYALYAYMRLVDDIADDTSNGRGIDQRRADLDQWQQHTHAAIGGSPSKSHILWPAFAELVHTYNIPAQLFDEMIEGQRQDLEPAPFSTFAELKQYCYRVASVVGLSSIYVWGFTDYPPETGETPTKQLAIDRGIAFQLTNILRDFREDLARGRLYFPAEDFAKFRISPDTLSPDSPELAAFLKFQVERAESYYQSSAPLAARISADSRPTLAAMTSIYHAILKKIAARPTVILAKRVRLSPISKLLLTWRAMRS